MIDRRLIAQSDWVLLATALTLALVGIATIFSATLTQGPYHYQRQFYWLLVGIIFMVAVLIFDYSLLERFAYFIYGASIITLVAVLVVGEKGGGAQRWLSLGFISFQPSEFAKVAFTIALAKHLSSKEVHHPGLGPKELIVPALLLLVPFLLVVKEPDLGTSLIFVLIFITMVLMVKVRFWTIVGSALAFASLLPFAFLSLKDYQKARLLSFLDPAKDPLGSGYHVLQSKIAIGSGGILGRGFTKGTQGSLMFLPEHHTDFVFPVLAEEWGFAGSFLLLVLFLVLLLRAIEITGSAKDRFGFLLSMGITSMIFWHLVTNMGMAMGLLPVVGVPLPFLSYGGSFLLTIMISIGILLNIGMRRFILG